MAQHKDYGLIGVGNTLQFGKQGPQMVRDGVSGGLNVTDENGTTPITLSGANATQSNHFVTKAQLDSVAADALVADVEYNSSTLTMGTIAAGTKTIQTVFTVDAVFDGNTEIKVGTDSTNDLLLAANYYDLTETGDYVSVSTLELTSDTQVKVFVTQGNSTVGNGTVVVSVLDGPVTGSSAGGSSGISLTDLSVSSASPSGNGSLTYNNTSGVFTFTPTDLSIRVSSDTTGITGADQVTNIVTLTQAEYDAINTPDASTVYIIVG